MNEFRPSTAHSKLGTAFYDPVAPADFPQTVLRYRNQDWAEQVGLGDLGEAEWLGHFGRFAPLSGSLSQPLALRYHGHQFRSYNPELGDGRGFLFAQLHDDQDRLLDLATKGSGQTPWSRSGDGRLTLKGGVREVLATSMLEALGVNTSKSFSLIETGEDLMRNDEPSPTRSSVLVRLSHSHIRIGTFQRLAYFEDIAGLQALLAHAVSHYLPEAARDSEAETAAAFLEAVCNRCAETCAQWTAAGFVHGVLNSDNINITGESFDYGPWRFLPVYDPDFTAAYFDETGLYAYGRQPDAVAWNLTRLAECLLPLGGQQELEAALNSFYPAFRAAMSTAFLTRLGLVSKGEEEDEKLIEALIVFLAKSQAPFEQVIFDLHGGRGEGRLRGSVIAKAYENEIFAPLREIWSGYKADPDGNLDHPYFAREEPRTMLIEEVEAIWTPIAERDDWTAFHEVLDEIKEMRAAYGHAP